MTEPKLFIQEILAKPDSPSVPLKDQEYYELRIHDSTGSWVPGFDVAQWRFIWSEIDEQFMFVDEETEHWPSLQSARNRYEARLHSLKERGFVHSDLEL